MTFTTHPDEPKYLISLCGTPLAQCKHYITHPRRTVAPFWCNMIWSFNWNTVWLAQLCHSWHVTVSQFGAEQNYQKPCGEQLSLYSYSNSYDLPVATVSKVSIRGLWSSYSATCKTFTPQIKVICSTINLISTICHSCGM